MTRNKFGAFSNLGVARFFFQAYLPADPAARRARSCMGHYTQQGTYTLKGQSFPKDGRSIVLHLLAG